MVDILIAIAMTLLVCELLPLLFICMLTRIVDHSFDECATMEVESQTTSFHVW